jgi:hypothetical protein
MAASAAACAEDGSATAGKVKLSGVNQTGIVDFDSAGDVATVASAGAMASDGPSVSARGDALVV